MNLRWSYFAISLVVCANYAIAGDSLIESVKVVAPFTAPDNDTYWMQTRAASIPIDGQEPLILMTLQKTDRVGTHMYHGLSASWSRDLGKTWTEIETLAPVDRIEHEDGLLEAPVDMTPQYHRKTGKVLATGATFWQDPKLHRDIRDGPSDTAYAVCDPKTRQWETWQKLKMPDEPKFHFARAGCTQRVDLPNGQILLPIYFHAKGSRVNYATVVRCGFDGQTLRYLTHGSELTVDPNITKRRTGLFEPSLTFYQGRYYLTARAEDAAYVAVSEDGLQFSEPRRWKFDDGEELGSYNTQQHWVTHSEGLYLSYTRRGANNDEIFRHRAPLFIARVDPERLVVERDTEQVLLPNMDDAFGNFGVCHVTPDETWVVDCLRFAKAGKPSVYVAKIRWSQPNSLAN